MNTRRHAEIVRRKVTEARVLGSPCESCSTGFAGAVASDLLCPRRKNRCVVGSAWRDARRYVVCLEICKAQTSLARLAQLVSHVSC